VNGNITSVVGDDGILVATIDMPGRSMNVFSDDLMDSLASLLDNVSSQPLVRGVVIVSGKRTFLVGADLSMVQKYTESARRDSVESLHTMCGRLGRLFRQLETCGKPFVAAVNGLALGGGLELALACHRRIASDDRGTQLGLPEIKLGLLPGAGGTQRLPRMAGTQAAFEMLLGGEAISAPRALELGVVDEVVPNDSLLTVAQRHALELSQTSIIRSWDRPGWRPSLNAYDFKASSAATDISSAAGLDEERLNHYPAYKAIIDSVIGGWAMPMDDACRWEMHCFVRLIQDPVAGNLVRTLFINRQRAMKSLGRGVAERNRQVAVKGPAGGPLSELLRQAKVLIASPELMPGSTIATLLTDPSNGDAARSDVAWLRGSATFESFRSDSGIWVSEASEHGRVAEVCSKASSVSADDAVLDLVRWLNAVPLFTRTVSLLQSLDGIQATLLQFTTEERLLATALEAARVWRLGGIDDTELADVACVIAGFSPPYTGGPFTYLRQLDFADLRARASRAAQRHGRLFEMPPGGDELWSTPVHESA
jgi:3-hydroxyacyl-CoA dehydrogenase/enoyl-CoA hydratase/3-hydroxybutyryl-CoA epimerase